MKIASYENSTPALRRGAGLGRRLGRLGLGLALLRAVLRQPLVRAGAVRDGRLAVQGHLATRLDPRQRA